MTFSIPRGPHRIVCLTEEPTEILYALGEQDRIVGISAYTMRPPQAKETKPVVSAFVSGSVNKIKALDPDLVIGFSDVQAEFARELIAAQLPVLIFNQRSIQEILEVITDVGALVGAAARCEALVAGYIAGLEAAAMRSARRADKPRVYFEEWDSPMYSGIRWVSEIIELAGGIDVFADKSHGKGAAERAVTMPELIAAQPDVMLASWCGKPFDAEAVRQREGAMQVPAIAARRMHEVPAEIILQPGPASLTDGLAHVEGLLKAVVRQ